MQENKKQIAIQIILLVLVASLAFGLGYLIRGDVTRAPIIIEKNSK